MRIAARQLVPAGMLAALAVLACSAGQATAYTAPRSISPANGATLTTGQLRDFAFVVTSDLRCADCSNVFDPWLGVVWSRRDVRDPATGLLAPASRVLCDQTGDDCAEPVESSGVIEILPSRASEEFDGRHVGIVYWQPFRRDCDVAGFSACAAVGSVRSFQVVRGDSQGFAQCKKKSGASVRVKRISCPVGRRVAGRFVRRLRSNPDSFPKRLGRYRCVGDLHATESICSRGGGQVKIVRGR